MRGPFAALGGRLWALPGRIGGFTRFSGAVVLAGWRLYVGRHGMGAILVSKRIIAAQVWFTGVQALPLIAGAGLLLSGAMMGVGWRLLSGLGADDEFGLLMRVLVVAHLGPLLTALIVIARSGTAITTELARMKLGDEIAAVRAHGIDPHAYLSVPRLIGVAAANFSLTVAMCAAAYLGVILIAPMMEGMSLPIFLRALSEAIRPRDAAACAAKAALYGFAIPAVTVREGFRVARDVNDVPRAGSRAVVACVILVFFLHALLALVLHV